MSGLRKVIFLVFLSIYLIVAPLTVLYALGYLFNPVQQTLLETGLISLDSDPSGANVWLDGSAVRDETPLVLHNLEPGIHDLRIALAGRRPWHRRVEVKPKRALRIENILLFPVSFAPEILGDFPVSKMGSAPEGKHLIVLEGDRASGLYLFELEEKKFYPVFPGGADPETRVQKIFLHPEGDRAVIFLRKGALFQPMLVRFTDPLKVTSLSGLIQEPLEKLQWSLARKSSVFYLKGDTLRRLDLERGVVSPVLVKGIQGYSLNDRGLFVLEKRGRFLKLNEKGRIQEVLFDDPSKGRLIFGPNGNERYSIFFLPNPFVFSALNDAIALFLSEKGRLLSNKLPYFLDDGVDELAVAASHPRIVYRKGLELWVVDFEREREKAFFESGPQPRKIHQGKEPLANPVWFYNDQYVLFLEGNRVKMQDFEGEGDAIELFRVSRRVPEIFLDARRGLLYFVRPSDERLARAKLFEETGLFSR